MTTTAPNLIRLSGLSATVAGVLFVFVGLLHPANTPASVGTGLWTIVHVIAFAVSFFGLLGLAGIYARQAEEAGWLGLIGFLLFSLWLTVVAGFVFFEALIFPLLATEAPAFAEGFMRVFDGSAGGTGFGVLGALWTLTGVLYMSGPLLFGIATLRAGILPRAAACVFAFGGVSSLAFALLPAALEPLATVPVGIGLAWLGYALLSERRESAPAAARGTAVVLPGPRAAATVTASP
jgi:hypothetical protein